MAGHLIPSWPCRPPVHLAEHHSNRCLPNVPQGSLMRATAATGMNRHSSRSHAVFTITLEQRRQV